MRTPEILYCFPDAAGESFQPSNGSEGMVFEEHFCSRCIHLHPNPDKDPKCEKILLPALCFEPGDPKYPKEWIYNDRGWPVCTAWKYWDWGNGDDEEWNEPPPPEPEDPNQLLIPFSITDYFDFECEIRVTKRGIFEVEQN